jgi:hypothetical protein
MSELAKLIAKSENWLMRRVLDYAKRFHYSQYTSTLEKAWCISIQGLSNELIAALAQVKQLSGLLPICASCKKVRDDKGYWRGIEDYISAHSEADFSHSLCPDCMKKLYPDLKK